MTFKKLIKKMASLYLAVFILSGLAVLTAIGTIVEAKYNDANAAGALVYKTPWMFFFMGLLVVNLTSVMIDRWPWQRKHLSFILAHIGIIILIFGSWVTMQYGLDGNVRVPIGGSSKWVQIPVNEFTVWATYDGSHFSNVFKKETDFLKNPPSVDRPLTVPLDRGFLKVIGYKPYVFANRRIINSQNNSKGSAVRFHLYNDRASVNDWLLQERKGEPVSFPMGPARVVLAKFPTEKISANEIYLQETNGKLEYTIYYRDDRTPKKGFVNEGEEIDTGWMGLKFHLLRFYPYADVEWDFDETSKLS